MTVLQLVPQTALEMATEWTAGNLAAPMPALSIKATCGDAFDWFAARPEQPAAAILAEDGSVAGMVNRLRFLAAYARRYYPELYSRRSILHLANENPLIVDEHVSVAELGASVALEHPEALSECFVVTSGGRYLGIGTGEALMRSKVALLQWREDELRAALEASHEAMRAKTNFLALMSHELRTPLNAIIGFSEVLGGELFGPIGQPRYREYAGDIHSAGKHLLALINDILDLTKAESGKLDLNDDDLDLSELVTECARLMRDRAMAGDLALLTDFCEPPPRLTGDRLRIKQVLLNLLSNAVKFTPPGGRVTASASIAGDGGIVLAVSDTGIGMSPEQIPLALEPFRQIDSPLSRNVEGTGLGLSLVKSLAELHDGVLKIESALNHGTTVAIHFPPQRTVQMAEEAAVA